MRFNDDALYHIIRNGMCMTVEGIELRNTDIVKNVEVPDSRENLERDIREFLTDGGRMAIKSGELKAIEDFLDRQAEITKRKIFRHYRSELERRTEREYKLQAEIDKRDKGIARLKARRNALQAELEAREVYPDGFMPNYEMVERIGELETKNIELKAERDRYRELASELLDAAHNMQLIADRGLA